MPDLQTRLIEAAVRPLADNAEMKLAATHLLESLDSLPDPAKLDAAMALLREAHGQPRCENYQSQMLRK